MSNMNKKTATALEGSIKKWEAIVDGSGKDMGCDNCPLCKLFYDDWCDGCPVKERTGLAECYGSPYENYRNCRSDANAKAELDFLKSLRPAVGQE